MFVIPLFSLCRKKNVICFSVRMAKTAGGEGDPRMVFCHEWVQIQNGTVEAMRLTSDLKCAAGEPVTLFHGSDAPWSKPWAENNYVTDGPMCKCVKDKKHIFCLKTVKQQSSDRKLSKNDWCWSIYE